MIGLYTTRSTCRVCGSRDLSLVMSYGDMPLAGGFVTRDNPKAHMKFPLDLLVCNECTLMQTGQDIHPDLMFSQYSYISGSSPSLVEHFRHLASSLSNRFSSRERVYIDVGCNDGTLIRFMKSLGEEMILGIDPSDVALEASKRDNWDLVNDYLSPSIADEVVNTYGASYLVTACNVLAHNPYPHPVVEGLRRLVERDGIIVAEVHYQYNLLKLNQFDTVYHEHTCYYSLRSLMKLFSAHDLEIWGLTFIENHGGSIRIFASPKNHNHMYNDQILKVALHIEHDYDWRSFKENALRVRENLLNEIADVDGSIWAYGASGRSTILLNWCGLIEEDIPFVLDRSPLRVGKVVPGVMIPIEDVSALNQIHPSTLLITAWNYAESIKRQHPNFDGKWLVPLPEVKYL